MRAKGFAVWEHSKHFKWYIVRVYTYGRYGTYITKSGALNAAEDYVNTDGNATKLYLFRHVIRPCMVEGVRR
jgi:hypothetical protein